MPLGSSKFSMRNKSLGPGTSQPVDLLFTITETLSGESDPNLTIDATTVTYNISSSVINSTIRYSFTGNVVAGDFTDSTLAANITTDGNGNATVTKTITTTTGGGHKDFTMNLVRAEFPNVILATTNAINLYEVIGSSVFGGDNVITSSYVTADANGDNHIVAHKVHQFVSPGNSTLTINDVGNYEGNTNIWSKYFVTDSNVSYWSDTIDNPIGIGFRSLIIAGGGSNAGGGAGELGSLKYPIANVGTGAYTVTVGSLDSNSIIFAGNASLQRISTRGGAGALNGSPGGSGGGQSGSQTTSYQGWANIMLEAGWTPPSTPTGYGSTDLASNPAPPPYGVGPIFSEHVVFASGTQGSVGLNGGGGGAFGRGSGAGGGTFNNPYNFPCKITPAGDGGNGVSWPGLKDGAQTDPGDGVDITAFPHRWFDSPVYSANANVAVEMAGGAPGSGGNNAIGSTGWGAGRNTGVVTFSYPYADTRFISLIDLS